MSITDELRSSVANYPFWDNRDFALFKDIADRIDAEHQRQLDVLYRDMSDAEWVRLPVDADGMPIHIGDVMEWTGGSNPLPVTAISLHEDGSWLIRINGCKVRPGQYRHHHTPTVEDVLREMVAAYMDTPLDDSNDDEFFAEYSAKLRLVDNGKEQ